MEQIVVVLDYGSKTLKAGYAHSFPSEEEPRVNLPNLVELTDQRPDATHSNIRFPVVRGKVASLEGVEALTAHALYDRLGWEMGSEGLVIVAEPVLTSKGDREQMAQMLFETFNVEGMYVQDQATLSLYALGRTSGCVLDVGHGKVDVSVVSDGQLSASTCRRMPFAGEDLTYYMQDLMLSRGVAGLNGGVHDFEALKNLCCSTADSASELDRIVSKGSSETKTFTLPDGQSVAVDSEGMQVGEALFRPQLLGHSGPGLADLALECVQTHYEGTYRRQAFEGMLVCGAASAIPGLSSRLVRELRASLPPSINPAVCPVPEYLQAEHTCRFAPWIGGAVLSKVLLQQGQFVGKADFDEGGPYSVHRKCC